VVLGDRAIGLVGTTLLSARVLADVDGHKAEPSAWDVSLELTMSFEQVSDLDVDSWSQSPAIAVLGDESIAIHDAQTGAHRARYAVQLAKHVKWIGPGWLMVLDEIESRVEPRTRVRVLDVVSGRWTEPVVVAEVSRIAVRGDEIHIGFANQSIAVWDRLDVCRGIGAWTFRSDVPESSVITTAPQTRGEAVALTALRARSNHRSGRRCVRRCVRVMVWRYARGLAAA
jgi:hypothetical protein